MKMYFSAFDVFFQRKSVQVVFAFQKAEFDPRYLFDWLVSGVIAGVGDQIS